MATMRIGELAGMAGTTTRAVRHYHAIGLLAEPARDPSGYRRYGPEDLVALVRIRRLRALGMPLDEIGRALGDTRDLPGALRALAADLEAQIAQLAALRERVLALSDAGGAVEPAEAWRAALQEQGVLAPGAVLPPGERRAADLLDALHPDGIAGVVDEAAGVLGDPAILARLAPLLARFRALDGEEAADALADELAAALPAGAPRPPLVDAAAMDALLGDRLSPAQRRCMHRVRARLEAA
jgi:DNA-binding transcriptional MerR regulator